MHTPKVSVCMPMYNASRFLRECIDSVLAQTFTDFEFLIADDGSTDNSVEIVESYSDPRIRLIHRPHDYIATLNCLLSEARGEYIARMDADDVMLPTRLQIEHDYLLDHSDVMAVCSKAIRIDSNSRQIDQCEGRAKIMRITPRMMCEANPICNPTSMIRGHMVTQGGLHYEREYELAEDYRLWTKIVLDYGPIDCLPQQLIKYRISEAQVTSRHHNEMMEISELVKLNLIADIVDRVNIGYTDPNLEDRGCELTLIIPFLNEGEEVENTIQSFQRFGGDRMDIIVINDCSYDSYPYMERLSSIPGVNYVLNRKRLGIAASRDKGVELCRTPYFLLLDAHMRAYDNKWLYQIPNLLHENDRRILCCQTRALYYTDTGKIIAQDYRTHFGARLTFTPDGLIPGIKWITEERYPNSDYEIIPAILGAGYGASKNYWYQIGGLRGLRQYGFDEQMLSLKTWLEGGVCILLKTVVLGHIYRTQMPYSNHHSIPMLNSLIISESLFPIKEKCKAKAYSYISNPQLFKSVYAMCSKIMKLDPLIANWCKTPISRTLDEVKQINRINSPIELKSEVHIKSRLQDIANTIFCATAPNIGIFDGKMAFTIWLFHYAQYSHSNHIRDYANRLLNETIRGCDFANISFKEGLSGIGWGILYLYYMGLIENLPTEFNDIDNAISNYISISESLIDNLSFRDGATGLLAYYCIKPISTFDISIHTKLNYIASKILAFPNNITSTEAFYAFIWQQIENKKSIQNEFQWSLSDWTITCRLLPKDSRFWKLSLFNGALATSIPFMLQ